MITIRRVKQINQGALKCEISVSVEKWGGFIIHNIRVFEKEQRKWIAFPSEEYEKDGEKKFFQLNGFEDLEIRDAFQKKVLQALDIYELNEKDCRLALAGKNDFGS